MSQLYKDRIKFEELDALIATKMDQLKALEREMETLQKEITLLSNEMMKRTGSL